MSDNALHCRPLHVLMVNADHLGTEALIRDFTKGGVSATHAITIAEAREALLREVVDVVILDIILPDGRGESLLPDIGACPRQPAVIFVSATLSKLRYSTFAYRPITITKSVSSEKLLRIVKTAARGYLLPAFERFFLQYKLTRREAEATSFVAQGLKPKEISLRMQCSEKVVYAHLSRVCRKTCRRDYHELVGMILAFSCQALGHSPQNDLEMGSITRSQGRQ
jgi:DNA-binding NarL/FixJ family response regulator